MTEKKIVHDKISNLITPDEASHLSADGVREFNKYAHGGYDVLLGWFDDPPRSLEIFLRKFYLKVNDAHSSGEDG